MRFPLEQLQDSQVQYALGLHQLLYHPIVQLRLMNPSFIPFLYSGMNAANKTVAHHHLFDTKDLTPGQWYLGGQVRFTTLSLGASVGASPLPAAVPSGAASGASVTIGLGSSFRSQWSFNDHGRYGSAELCSTSFH